jgi:hypothetical protein
LSSPSLNDEGDESLGRGLEMMSRSFEAGIDTKSLANLLKLARIQELFRNVGRRSLHITSLFLPNLVGIHINKCI